MLSLFPQLFDFVIPATALMRMVVGIIFIIEAKRNFSKNSSWCNRIRSIIELLGGVFLTIGLFVQAVALLLSLTIIMRVYEGMKAKTEDKRVYSFYVLLFFITLSFLFFGPGMLSIDFPL